MTQAVGQAGGRTEERHAECQRRNVLQPDSPTNRIVSSVVGTPRTRAGYLASSLAIQFPSISSPWSAHNAHSFTQRAAGAGTDLPKRGSR
eukprot:2836862-Rhodomonas_salina.9